VNPRQRGKVTYPLDEILLLCLLTTQIRSPDSADGKCHLFASFLSKKKTSLPCLLPNLIGVVAASRA
jgi:hypothetical protein